MFRQLGVFCFEGVLDLDRAAHGVYYTRKFRQQVIAGRVNDAAPVALNEGRDKFTVKNPDLTVGVSP